MSKKIQIDWSTDDDLILAEVVLRHIRTGKKMGDAWIEASQNLKNRTPGACQNRWSTVVSKRYDASVEQAKLQRMSYIEKVKAENEGDAVLPEIVLPKNRPINPISDAMERALEATKNNSPFSSSHIIPMKKEYAPKDVTPVASEVSAGISEEENIEKRDSEKEKSPDNPFFRIRKFVHKMEKEYGDMAVENIELKEKINSLENQLHIIQASNEETIRETDRLRESLAFSDTKISDLENDISELEKTLSIAKHQLQTYGEIKELIQKYNSLNK